MNPEKIDEIEAGGLEFVGRDESGLRMEIAEIPRETRPESEIGMRPEGKSRLDLWSLPCSSRDEGTLPESQKLVCPEPSFAYCC